MLFSSLTAHDPFLPWTSSTSAGCGVGDADQAREAPTAPLLPASASQTVSPAA
jgi:hypothetical protein